MEIIKEGFIYNIYTSTLIDTMMTPDRYRHEFPE